MTKQKKYLNQTTPQQYLDFAKSQYLKEAVITAAVGISGDGIKAVDGDENSFL